MSRSTYTATSRSTKDPLQRRVPKNPKYEHIERVVDSGSNVNKVRNITTREYLKRKGELYRRIKPTTLYGLMVDNEGAHESIYDLSTISEGEGKVEVPAAGGPRVAVTHGASAEAKMKPYIVLDCRDPEDWATCHLTESVSFPKARLSQDRITSQLFAYKNKADHLIVVYSNEEKISSEVCKMFVEKGWENVYLLSGGLKKVAEMYPLLIEGPVPAELLPSPKKGISSRGSSMSSRASVRSGGASVAGSRYGGRTARSSATRAAGSVATSSWR